MTALILVMLRARRAQALTMFALAVLATAAAVAAPCYLSAVDRAVVAGEVEHAAVKERTLLISEQVDRGSGGDISDDFEALANSRVQLPGFTTVFSSEFLAMPDGLDRADDPDLRHIVFREDVCAHLVVTSGRCLMGGGETVLGEAEARRLKVGLGDRITDVAATFDSGRNSYVPDGVPWTMTVVGIVRPRDPAELYWGNGGGQDGPLYVARNTLSAADHRNENQAFDSYATPSAITVERLPAVRAYFDAEAAAGTTGGNPQVTTALPDLLDRIDRNRAAARQTVPPLGIPVVVLSWVVIGSAAALVARARRREFGIVALRGVPRTARLWLATAETGLAVLAGAPVGFLVGWLVVGALAPAPPHLDTMTLVYAGGAVLGAIVACAAVQVRTVAVPVSALLREVDRRSAHLRSLAFDVLVVLGAVAAVVQARQGPVVGVTLLAPTLVTAAFAVLAARALPPAAQWFAGRRLGRGGLVGGLVALRLARTPTGRRLLVVLVVAVGSLTYAGVATAISARDRHQAAEQAVGADTVLSIGPTTRDRLVRAVRRADPGGRAAMAVVPIDPTSSGMPPVLAVDSTRLAAVALWDQPDKRALADRLRPADATPTHLRSDRVSVDLTVTDLGDTNSTLEVDVVPDDGGPREELRYGTVGLGRHTYTTQSDTCATGCSLVDVNVDVPNAIGPPVNVVLHRVQDQTVDDRWHVAAAASATPTADGLAITIPPSARGDAGEVRPPDVPTRLPLIATGPLPPDGSYAWFAGSAPPAIGTVAATVPGLPRLGDRGVLLDLSSADRVATDSGSATGGEVWLARGAPSSIVDKLKDDGLTVVGTRSVAAEQAGLARRGSALALRFALLGGALAVLLGAAGLLVTTFADRRGTLAPLRTQGLSRRLLRRVEVWTPATMVLLALPLGLVAGVLAWLATGLAHS
jgi:putative ABC transport system permease protein